MIKLRIAEVAQQKGIKITRFKEESGLSWSIADRYWHNKIRGVSLDTLEKIAEFLGVHVTDLIKEN